MQDTKTIKEKYKTLYEKKGNMFSVLEDIIFTLMYENYEVIKDNKEYLMFDKEFLLRRIKEFENNFCDTMNTIRLSDEEKDYLTELLLQEQIKLRTSPYKSQKDEEQAYFIGNIRKNFEW